jgi:hypothetical protein
MAILDKVKGQSLAAGFAPGFLPGALGGIEPATRQRNPSNGLSSLNRVTLHWEISPRDFRSERDARTFCSEMPVAVAISESKC